MKFRNSTRPWEFESRLGNLGNISQFTLRFNSQIVGTTRALAWNSALTPYFPTAAETMTISSTNANDALGGTRANAVQITYLDANYNQQTTIVYLNGTTEVTITPQMIRVNEMKVVLCGSNAAQNNQGTIWIGTGTVTAGVPANPVCFIEPTLGWSYHGIYTVPANKSAILNNGLLGSASNILQEAQLVVRLYGTNTQSVAAQYQVYRTNSILENVTIAALPAKTDLLCYSFTTSGTATISGNVGLFVVDATESSRNP